MIIRISGMPTITIAGTSFSANVPVTMYDDNGWAGASTTVVVTGNLSDSGSTFIAKVKTESDNWKTKVSTTETFETKLTNIVGRVL